MFKPCTYTLQGFLCLLLVCGLMSCAPVVMSEQVERNDTSITNSTPFPITTTTITETLVSSTSTNQPVTEPNVEISLPCLASTTSDMPDQMSYEGIYPGLTTADTLKDILGSPLITNSYEPGIQEWLFELNAEMGTFPIRLEDGVVSFISVPSEIPLTKVLNENGCPDVVFAVDMSEHKTGQYSAAFLIYLHRGVEFVIEQFPFDLSSHVSVAHYFRPASLEDFLRLNPEFTEETIARRVFLRESLK